MYDGRNVSGSLLLADFKKDFNSAEWEFLFRVLHKFNFVQNFQE